MTIMGRLLGTLRNYVRLGENGTPEVRVQNDGDGGASVRNSSIALVVFRVATPVGNDDAVTKDYLLEGRVAAWGLFDAAGVRVRQTPLFTADAVVTVEAAPVAHVRYRINHASIPIADAVADAVAEDFRIVISVVRNSDTQLDVRTLNTSNAATASAFNVFLLARN